MGKIYEFADLESPVDQEERRTKERRLFTYSAAALSAAEAVERVYVMFEEFKSALGACDRIYQLSRHLQTPQGAQINGPPGSCKTTLAEYFVKSLPPSNLFEVDCGVIVIRLRANPTQGLIVSLLLHALKYPFTEVRRSRLYTMRDLAFEAIRGKGVKLVFVDQGHCLATQARPKGTDVHENAATDTLREMMDATSVGLVILADSSFKTLEQVDPALADRVSVRVSLNHFSNDGHWVAFLNSFVSSVTVCDLGFMTSEIGVAATHAATAGNRRSFRRLVTEVVLIAIDAGQPKITGSHMRLAFERVRGVDSTTTNPYVD